MLGQAVLLHALSQASGDSCAAPCPSPPFPSPQGEALAPEQQLCWQALPLHQLASAPLKPISGLLHWHRQYTNASEEYSCVRGSAHPHVAPFMPAGAAQELAALGTLSSLDWEQALAHLDSLLPQPSAAAAGELRRWDGQGSGGLPAGWSTLLSLNPADWAAVLQDLQGQQPPPPSPPQSSEQTPAQQAQQMEQGEAASHEEGMAAKPAGDEQALGAAQLAGQAGVRQAARPAAGPASRGERKRKRPCSGLSPTGSGLEGTGGTLGPGIS